MGVLVPRNHLKLDYFSLETQSDLGVRRFRTSPMVSSLSFFVPKGSKKDSIGVKLDSAGLLASRNHLFPFISSLIVTSLCGDALCHHQLPPS